MPDPIYNEVLKAIKDRQAAGERAAKVQAAAKAESERLAAERERQQTP